MLSGGWYLPEGFIFIACPGNICRTINVDERVDDTRYCKRRADISFFAKAVASFFWQLRQWILNFHQIPINIAIYVLSSTINILFLNYSINLNLSSTNILSVDLRICFTVHCFYELVLVTSSYIEFYLCDYFISFTLYVVYISFIVILPWITHYIIFKFRISCVDTK